MIFDEPPSNVPYELDGLSVRAANSLNNFGIHNRKEALAAIQSEKLTWRPPRCHNFGRVSYIEVCKWIGLKPPFPGIGMPRLKTCPGCGFDLINLIPSAPTVQVHVACPDAELVIENFESPAHRRKRLKRATMNHTLTAKGSLAEFEIAFKKKFGLAPVSGYQYASDDYKELKRVAKWAWLAREKVY